MRESSNLLMADCIWDEAHIRRLLPGMRSYQSTDFLIFSLWPAQRGRQWVKGSMVHPVFGRPHRAVRLSFFSVVMAKGQWHVFRCSEAVRWAPQSLNWMPRVDSWHNCVHCVQHFKVFVCSRSLSLLVLRELGSLTDVSHPVGEQRFRRRPFDSLTLRLGESSRNQNNDWTL